MAIAYVAGTTAGDASGGNLTINKPAGTVDGHILLLTVYREGGTLTLPSGFAQIIEQRDGGNNQYTTTAWKRASGEGASYSIGISTTTWRIAALAAFSGCVSSGSPVDVSAGNNSTISNTLVAASITTTAADTMCVVGMANYDGTDIAAGSSGYTQGAQLGGCELWYAVQASAGASGSKTFSAASTSRWATVHLALKPATGGTNYAQSVAGGLTPSGATLKQGRKVVAGAFTPAGALLRAVSALRAGVLTPAGVFLRRANRSMTGTLSPAGAFAALRAVLVVLAGALAPAGVTVRRVARTALGSLAPAGSLASQISFLRTFTGAMTPVGVTLKRAGKAATGALAPAGSLLKRAQRLWAGALAGAGALATQIVTGAQTFYVTAAGALAPSGALLKRAQASLAGVLTPAGALVRRAARGMAGALAPSGSFAALKVLLRLFTGALAPAGVMVRRAGRGMAGQLAAAGVNVRSTALRWTGALIPTGAFTGLRRLVRIFAGTLTPTGSLATGRALLLLVSGALAPSGVAVRSVGKQIAGTLAPVGTLARSTGKWLSGALSAAGGMVAQVFGLSNVRLTVALADAAVTACTLTDAAPSICTLTDTVATRLTVGDTLYEQL